jgi:hypothetical protein
MNRPASKTKRREGSAERVRAYTPALAVASLLLFSTAGCVRDEPPVTSGGHQNGPVPADAVLHLGDARADLDRAEERLEGSGYPLKPIANPDPNQYGADGGRALRCDLVGVDLFFWTFDDGARAREAGERWEAGAGHPLRWTATGNLLLVLFSDDDFTGTSAEAAVELMKVFAAEGDGGTGGEG